MMIVILDEQHSMSALEPIVVDSLREVMKAAFDAATSKRTEAGTPFPYHALSEFAFAEGNHAYKIMEGGRIVGAAIVRINPAPLRDNLELLFLDPARSNRVFGLTVWRTLERLYPTIEVRETYAPVFATGNIHFYVNKRGLHIVEYFNKWHKDLLHLEDEPDDCPDLPFEKRRPPGHPAPDKTDATIGRQSRTGQI